MNESTIKVSYVVRYSYKVGSVVVHNEVKTDPEGSLPKTITLVNDWCGDGLVSLRAFKVITTEKEIEV